MDVKQKQLRGRMVNIKLNAGQETLVIEIKCGHSGVDSITLEQLTPCIKDTKKHKALLLTGRSTL